MGMHLFRKLDCANKLRVDPDLFKIWLKRIEDKYQNHPYHNKIHATDVVSIIYKF